MAGLRSADDSSCDTTGESSQESEHAFRSARTVSRLQSPRSEMVSSCSKLQITVTVVYLNGTPIVPLRRSWCCDAMACQLITGVEHATGKSGKLIFNPARTEFYTPERTSGATELRGNVTFARQGVANATILTFVACEHVASFSMSGLVWRNNFDRANKIRCEHCCFVIR